MKNKKRTKKIVLLALLVAIMVIFSRFISIETEFLKFSFTFIPEAITGALFGPIWTPVATVAADFIGMWIAPKAQFFFGFTLNALITGVIYGYFLGKKEVKWSNIAWAVILNAVIVRLLLTPLWLYMMYHMPLLAIMPVRILKQCITVPLEIIALDLILRRLPLARWRKEIDG